MPFAHLTIPTTDVHATCEFFVNVMHWNSIPMPENVEIDAAWLEIANGQQLHILGIEDCPVPQDQEFGRHFALFHPGSDFDDLEDRVIANGGRIETPIRSTPFRRVFFRDINNYLFELIDQDAYHVED